MTRWPNNRSRRASESPRIVERIWPTCIGLATFGELKSTTTVRGSALFSKKRCSPRAADCNALASADVFSRKFKTPAPATSTCSHHSLTSSLAVTSAANWRGFNFCALASFEPASSPAMRKLVFLDTESPTVPPISLMRCSIWGRLWCSRRPVTTIVRLANGPLRFLASSAMFTPGATGAA